VAHRDGCPFCAISNMVLTDDYNYTNSSPVYQHQELQMNRPQENGRKKRGVSCTEEVGAGVLNDPMNTIDEDAVAQILQFPFSQSTNVNTSEDGSWTLEDPGAFDLLLPSPALQEQQPDCPPKKRWCGSGGTCEIMTGGGSNVFNDPSRIERDCRGDEPPGACRQRTVHNICQNGKSNAAVATTAENTSVSGESMVNARLVKASSEAAVNAQEELEKGADGGTHLHNLIHSVQYVVGALFRWITGKML